MPANILNLPDYTVVRVEESDHDYHVYADTSNTPVVCAVCGSDRLSGHGRNEQVIRDLPTHGKRLAIYVDTRRWRCLSCGKTFMEKLPAVNAKREMTERLTRWIGQQSLKRTFASIADDTGLDEKTIRNIFRDYINELEQTVRFETPTWMGIDEIHIINKPRCVVSNIQNNTIVDLLHNRNKDTVAKYLFTMPNRDKVQYVAMDMWTPYRDAVSAVLPDATIVIDKFHVVRMANDAMEKARKGLRAELSTKQKRGLMHDRFVLLKRERDLNDKEILNLDGWTKNYQTLGEAYRLKEDFYGIYEAVSPVDAMQRYEAWLNGMSTDIKPYFSDLIRAFTNWQPLILNYFKHPVTNAYTESLNSLIRVMNRLGRGYSFDALRAKILFTEGVHAHKQKRPRFERQRSSDRVESASILSDQVAEYGVPVSGQVEQKVPAPHKGPKPPKNYGADISTLIGLIESGDL